MKSFSRKFMPTNISVTGDTANVTGNYAGAIVNGSASTASNGSFTATLRKQGNRWVITDLKM